eukprot:CAMPEP_0194068334 /NCGR_PEP_ID=MMETSP0009_2-20130614/87036_1 /TAXON_ID=210454 /ORGANISM="Grammatophora oceanica, Strain CCMP 410" /LENGTH=1125 /DNA_ID=CAMNT_0038721423 /DNA_START=118 /DNA_END=3495 /DNA_ORIENTATION=-
MTMMGDRSNSLSSELFVDETTRDTTRFLKRLGRLHSVGHKEEKKVLKRAFERVLMGGMSEVILLHGEAGVGKTALATGVLKKRLKKRSSAKSAKTHHNHKSKKHRGYFVSGKFDQLRTNTEPYSAIVDAFSDICDMIARSDDEDHKREVRARLRRSLAEDDDAAIVAKLIPNLSTLLEVDDVDGDGGGEDKIGRVASDVEIGTTSNSSGPLIQPAFVKFKLLCRAFLMAVATEKVPVILFLDDLQWADDGSMDVFKWLCSDMNSKNDLQWVLIVGSYRDDEDYRPPSMDTMLPCTDLPVPRFGLKDIKFIVSTLTEMDLTETRSLSDIVFAKTRGNAQFVKLFLESLFMEKLLNYVFAKTRGNAQFVKLFLESLFMEKLLNYSPEIQKWRWDVEKVQAETNDASNMLIAAKIDRLSVDVQEVLKLASCLGFVFEVEHLRLIVIAEYENLTGKRNLPGEGGPAVRSPSEKDDYWKKHLAEEAEPVYLKVLLKLLHTAKKSGILAVGRRTGTFSFSHDRVFEAVYASLPTGFERQQLHVRIGRLLLDSFPHRDLVTFLAVDQLNQGAAGVISPVDRLNLVRLNLSTARLAISKSAFDRAQDFIAGGMQLFTDELWSIDYRLALELYTTGAEAIAVNGNPESFVDSVVLHGKTLQDKIPAYNTMMNFLGWQNRMEEAFEFGLGILRLLGENISKNANKLHVAWEFVMAKRAVGRMSDTELLGLPLVRDTDKVAVLKTLREISSYAYFSHPDLMIVTILRAVRVSIQHGIHPEVSPSSFAGYGMLHVILKDPESCLRFNRVALQLMEKHDSKYIRPTVEYIAHGLGNHIRSPIETLIDPLMGGFRAGISYGDLGHGLGCAHMACCVKFMVGSPLQEVERQLERYTSLMQVYNKTSAYLFSVIIHQRVLNLLGRSEHPTILTGTAMNQEEHYQELVDTGNELALFVLLEHAFQLHYLYEDWDNAIVYHKEALRHPEALRSLEVHLYHREYKFTRSLLYFEQYRQTRSRKYKKRALQVVKLMKREQAAGCPNYDSYIPILDAEMVMIKKESTWEEVDAAYKDAVKACKYSKLRALAHERAAWVIGEHFHRPELVKEHLEGAKLHYLAWEAFAKVRHIDEKLKPKTGPPSLL